MPRKHDQPNSHCSILILTSSWQKMLFPVVSSPKNESILSVNATLSKASCKSVHKQEINFNVHEHVTRLGPILSNFVALPKIIWILTSLLRQQSVA